MRLKEAALPIFLGLGSPRSSATRAMKTARLIVKIVAKVFLYEEAYLSIQNVRMML